MDGHTADPMGQLIAKLEEARKLPKGLERDKRIKEAQELFAPAAEELSILGDTIGSLTETNQNGESLKSFMDNAGVSITAKPTSSVVAEKPKGSIKSYWDRKKGPLAIGMTIIAATFIALNIRNIKVLNDFLQDENLVGLFEDWMGMTNPEDEEDRETPLNWRELEESE